MAKKDTNLVQATQTSLRLIETIQEMDGATMAELTNELGMARSTVFSHLHTLQESGYVTKRGEIYHLDFKFLFLGEYTKRRNDAYKLAETYVKEIAGECDEYVDFCVEQNGRVLTVHLAVNGIQNPRFTIAEYYYMPTTAQGKALLAHLPHDRVEEIIEQWGLPQETENTITSEDRLFDELETIREQGYAVSYQECIDGMRAVAVPLVEPDGSLFGTFGISGPRYKLTDEMIESELVELLVEGKTGFEAESEEIYRSI
ncbi:IclR family transcriptional regulator [Natrinema halophilum]|uniref:IclR family transcriptional regulator n=1 Tax=Natrinema halophilum TaxID=1699371 RepID=A0A7D5GJ43_9EURY|nr:IclR family transcriptional regulator [Natrinema halophilum]QLG50207.1 IclR family transcriptional regulator [Natrinema halophilum]